MTSFQTHGEACAATWAHAHLIAASPDAWSAVGCDVPRELIEAIDAAIGTATAPTPLPSPVPTPSTLS